MGIAATGNPLIKHTRPRASSRCVCRLRVLPGGSRAQRTPTPHPSNRSDSATGCDHNVHDFQSSTSQAPSNKAAFLESQTIQLMQHLIGQTLRHQRSLRSRFLPSNSTIILSPTPSFHQQGLESPFLTTSPHTVACQSAPGPPYPPTKPPAPF